MSLLGKIILWIVGMLCFGLVVGFGMAVFETTGMLIFYLFCVVLYFLPTIVAMAINGPVLVTFLVNFFAGWSLIGWVISFVIAVRK